MADPLVGGGYGLGRGLEALIPAATTTGGAEEVALGRISPNPHQPRRAFLDADLEALAASIRSHGILQPLVVRVGAGGDYELVAGERRLRAARLAGLTHVPVIVRSSTEVEMLQLALIENLQRADLNPLEEALAFDELASSFGLTHEQIANQVGRSRAAVTNAIRLLDLADETRRALLEGRISEGHGRALAALTHSRSRRLPWRWCSNGGCRYARQRNWFAGEHAPTDGRAKAPMTWSSSRPGCATASPPGYPSSGRAAAGGSSSNSAQTRSSSA